MTGKLTREQLLDIIADVRSRGVWLDLRNSDLRRADLRGADLGGLT